MRLKFTGNFIDLLVEDTVILELKSIERHDPVFEAQILSYMKLTGKKVGLLINFNSKMVKDGDQALRSLNLKRKNLSALRDLCG